MAIATKMAGARMDGWMNGWLDKQREATATGAPDGQMDREMNNT
jgi:hypothetical protein